MKTILKSKTGFTLIELLVVIGILAVLAAIAIPSVAGLIDRANVSADATNANEMTNAVERFTSEYELYCQDIASDRVKAGDLDSAQGRVFNVTGADSREDIELLESTGLNGKQINRDTKYPTNATTMQSLVENYMKTSSTTFTPKQSDCHYYYSPDCGVVVCTETAKSSTTDLNALIQSGKDAKGNTLGDTTQWIDLTANTSVNNNGTETITHSGIIPENGKYYSGISSETCENNCDGSWGFWCVCNLTVHNAGETFPEPKRGDMYVYGNYIYLYGMSPQGMAGCPFDFSIDGYSVTGVANSSYQGWCVLKNHKDAHSNDEKFNTILEEINGKPLVSISELFSYEPSPSSYYVVPNSVKDISYAFFGLYNNPAPSETTIIEINSNISSYQSAFANVNFQKEKLILTGTFPNIDELGCEGINYCTECNGYCELGHELVNPW